MHHCAPIGESCIVELLMSWNLLASMPVVLRPAIGFSWVIVVAPESASSQWDRMQEDPDEKEEGDRSSNDYRSEEELAGA